MRMIKKICSVICAAVIALGGVNIVVTAQDTENHKSNITIRFQWKVTLTFVWSTVITEVL